jgi:hypothetical protein
MRQGWDVLQAKRSGGKAGNRSASLEVRCVVVAFRCDQRRQVLRRR